MDQADGDRDDVAIERALDRAEREWRRMRVVKDDRATLRDDLRMELTASAADGVPPDQLIGPDVARFARDLATSAGVRLVSFEYRRLLLTGLAGAAPGVALAWVLIMHWWWLPWHPPTVSRYAVCAAVFVAGVLIAIHRGMRGDPAQARTVTAMAVAVPVVGLLMVPAMMGFASLVGYSTMTHVLVIEAAIVGAALAGGAVAARQWAVAPMLDHR